LFKREIDEEEEKDRGSDATKPKLNVNIRRIKIQDDAETATSPTKISTQKKPFKPGSIF
jgi:hypothetical protein